MSAKAAKVKISDPDAASWWAETFPDQNKVDNQEFKSAILARFDDINDEVTEAHEDIVDLVVDKGQSGSVTKSDFDLFIQRFGPFEQCLTKTYDSLFEEGQIVEWFHGNLSNTDATKLLLAGQDGSYLVRLSSKPNALTLVFRKDAGVKNISVKNYGAKGYDYGDGKRSWANFQIALAYFKDKGKILHAERSALAEKSAQAAQQYIAFAEGADEADAEPIDNPDYAPWGNI